MTAVRNVLHRRPRTVSPLVWLRCTRCNRLTFSNTIVAECDLCVVAAEKVWPELGRMEGEMSGC